VRAPEIALAGVLEYSPKVWVSADPVPGICEDFIDQECEGLPRERNVNSGGPTTILWIKRLFGFCGELWWAFRLFVIVFCFCLEFWVATDGNLDFWSTKYVDNLW
jgi:hypothetical protein